MCQISDSKTSCLTASRQKSTTSRAAMSKQPQSKPDTVCAPKHHPTSPNVHVPGFHSTSANVHEPEVHSTSLNVHVPEVHPTLQNDRAPIHRSTTTPPCCSRHCKCLNACLPNYASYLPRHLSSQQCHSTLHDQLCGRSFNLNASNVMCSHFDARDDRMSQK